MTMKHTHTHTLNSSPSLHLRTSFLLLYLQAFAWWTDLMVEHAENFLAFYAVDMDAALEIQSPESWDSFPLFQLLNDFLRSDCELLNPSHHPLWCFSLR